MSISLAEALETVDLKPGATYFCKVNGNHVEVRVLGLAENTELRGKHIVITEDDLTPMDRWIEFPLPKPICRVRAKPGKLPPPDRPVFPGDDEVPT